MRPSTLATMPPPALMQRNRWRVQRRVPPKLRRAQQRAGLLVLLLLGLVFLYGFGYSRTVSYELWLNQRQKDIKHLKEENALLRARVVQVQSAARIDQRVSQTLQMQLPDRIEYVPIPRYVIQSTGKAAAAADSPAILPPLGY